MNPLMIQCLGWTATAVFVGSYFFGRPALLRKVQMLGALLWITYGALIGAAPVMVANVLVFAAAAWTALRKPVAARSSALVLVPCMGDSALQSLQVADTGNHIPANDDSRRSA